MRALWLGCVFVAFALLALVAMPRRADAHPMLQDRVELRVEPNALDFRIRTSMKTVVTVLGREPAQGAFYSADELTRAVHDEVPYVLAHLHVEADGVPMAPEVVSAELEARPTAPVHRLKDIETVFAMLHLRYALRRAPARLRLEQDILEDIVDPRGGRFVLDQIVELHDASGAVSTHVLRPTLPLELPLAGAPPPSTLRTFFEFVRLGATHILAGLDHLLFLAAVVLGAASVRSLVLVVLAFTLAHTTTLALATFGVVAIPSAIVEPLIGLSIVVAAAVALRPPSPRSTRIRALVAFGFGLVHGLGFAGGLVEALRGDRERIVLALVAFTLGVELVQQALVVPVFLLARAARKSPRTAPWIERAALGVVALGLLFFFQALRAMRGE